MKITNGPLPKSYPNWMAFYRDIKKEGLLEESRVIKSPDFDDHKISIYEFDLWYIKCKCFDEISEMQNEFTVHDLDQIARALHSYENGVLIMDLENNIHQKISEKINLRYEFGLYD